MIVHLNGWPGVGKRTIGAVLAKNLRARFFHNNLLYDIAVACTGLDDPERWVVYEEVRAAAYTSLGKLPASEALVMTNALRKNAPLELEAWQHIVDLAMVRRVPLVPVVLEATPEENIRRLQSSERVGKKLADPTELRSYFASDTLQYPDVRELLVLGVTHLAPEEAAARIEGHLDRIRASLQPAGLTHLRLR
jgi:broad-specificity NMP kinase